ncbi:MAG: signal peptidase I [Pseudomonadota bacterium]
MAEPASDAGRGLPPGKRKVDIGLAVFAAFFGGGLGYVYLGRITWAFWWLAILFGVITLFALSPFTSLPAFVYLFLLSLLTITIGVIFHCGRLAAKHPIVDRKPYNKAWVYISWLLIFWCLGSFFPDLRAKWLGFDLYSIPSMSMAPTLEQGDLVTADARRYDEQTLQYGDIVVFENPQVPGLIFVKRVVGLPGDVIEIKTDVLYRNGEAIDEPYALFTSPGNVRTSQYPPESVRDGYFFVLGDNRHRSQDSRFLGPIPLENLRGRIENRWFAWSEGPRWERFPHQFTQPE